MFYDFKHVDLDSNAFNALEVLGSVGKDTQMRDKLIESLEAMEECAQACEIMSKSWKDFWVVQRALVRAMWLVLTWIIRQVDKK